MAPTLSQALGFNERQENPSILTTGHDDFDFADDWNEQDNHSTLRWRNSCPDKRPSPSSSRWSSCLTSLSSSVSTALTKQLSVGESTRRAISQLRNSMIEVSTRTESSLRASMPVRHRFSEADIGRFEDQPESEKAGDEDMEENASDEDKKRLHSTKSRTQDFNPLESSSQNNRQSSRPRRVSFSGQRGKEQDGEGDYIVCRSEAQPADTSGQVDSRASPDQDSSKRDGSSSQSDSPAMKTRLQEFEPTCKMQLEDVNVVDVPASTTVAKKPKLIEWLEKFEAQHLKELKGVGSSDDQVMAAASPQISRLAAWLAAFEAKNDGLESGQPR